MAELINKTHARLYVLAGIAAYCAASVCFRSGPGCIVSLVLFTACAAWVLFDTREASFVVIMLVAAFLFRAVLMYLLHIHSFNEGFGGFVSGDDRLYSLKALKISLQWLGLPYDSIGDIGGKEYGLNLYTYILAVYYKLFGGNYLASKLINCFIGAVTTIPVYLFSRNLFSVRTARVSMGLAAFLPSLAHWSAANLRDPLIILLTVLVLYCLTNQSRGIERIVKLAGAACMVYLLKDLQILNVVAIAGAIFVYAVLRGLWLIHSMRLKVAVILSVALYAFSLIVLYRADIFRQLNFIVYRNFQLYVADSSGYCIYTTRVMNEISAGIFNVFHFVTAYMKGLTYFLFSPFPWAMNNLNQLAAYPQMLLWYFLSAMAIPGIVCAYRLRRGVTVFTLAFLIVGTSLWALSEANVGAAFRHRDYFTLFAIVFASGGLTWTVDTMKRTAGR